MNNANYPSSNWDPYNMGVKQRIITVNGRDGAETYRIGPDSNAILLDNSGKMVWIVATDGAGYRTVKPYDITPHVEPEPPDYNLVLARMNKLEELINGFISAANSGGASANAASTTINTADAEPNDFTKQF